MNKYPQKYHQEIISEFKKALREGTQNNSTFYQANKLSNIISDKLGSDNSKYKPYIPWLRRVESVLTLCKINEQLIKLEQPDIANSILLFKGIAFSYYKKVRPRVYYKKLLAKESLKGNPKITDELRRNAKEMIYQM